MASIQGRLVNLQRRNEYIAAKQQRELYLSEELARSTRSRGGGVKTEAHHPRQKSKRSSSKVWVHDCWLAVVSLVHCSEFVICLLPSPTSPIHNLTHTHTHTRTHTCTHTHTHAHTHTHTHTHTHMHTSIAHYHWT